MVSKELSIIVPSDMRHYQTQISLNKKLSDGKVLNAHATL